MAKTKNHRRRTRHTRRHRNRRGGSSHYPAPNPSDYSSGASFVSASVGSGDDQYSNVFASSKNISPSNTIVGLQGQNMPPGQSMTQKAGNRRKKHGKSKKGGYWSTVINQAALPFALWTLQHNYKRKGNQHTRHNKHE